MKVKLAFLMVSMMVFSGSCLAARQSQVTAMALARVHSIYIAPMPNGFDQYLAAELLKRLPKGVTLSQTKAHANAVLEGIDESSSHGISRTVNQVFGVGGSASGAVRLLSSTGQILWAAAKTDHTIPIYGTWRQHGMDKVASRIAKDLAGALKSAQKRERREERKMSH